MQMSVIGHLLKRIRDLWILSALQGSGGICSIEFPTCFSIEHYTHAHIHTKPHPHCGCLCRLRDTDASLSSEQNSLWKTTNNKSITEIKGRPGYLWGLRCNSTLCSHCITSFTTFYMTHMLRKISRAAESLRTEWKERQPGRRSNHHEPLVSEF